MRDDALARYMHALANEVSRGDAEVDVHREGRIVEGGLEVTMTITVVRVYPTGEDDED